MNKIKRWFEEWSWRRELRRQLKSARKQQKALRAWRSVSPSQQVELGVCNYDEALRKCETIGRVSYTDFEHGIIFVNTDLGHSAQGAAGRSGD